MHTVASLLIGGDICPVGRNERPFAAGDAHAIFGDILPELEEADAVIANLECPLIVKATPAVKGGPVLGAPTDCVRGLQAAGIDVVNLANNHIMDHGAEGLESTMRVCADAGIATVGAGFSADGARKLLVQTAGNVRTGVLGIAEWEYSIAGGEVPGANGMDTVDLVRSLRACKVDCDFLLVLVHGGNEYFPYPRPGLLKLCRFLVEEGAQVVVCQQSHCVGTYEEYKNGLIVYGQGDFVFDHPGQHPVKQGILVKICISRELTFSYEFVPFREGTGKNWVTWLDRRQSDAFLGDLADRSLALKSDEILRERWLKFCETNRNTYLSMVLGMGNTLRRFNRTGVITRFFYRRGALRTMGNVIRCESHREVLITLANEDLERERRSRTPFHP